MNPDYNRKKLRSRLHTAGVRPPEGADEDVLRGLYKQVGLDPEQYLMTSPLSDPKRTALKAKAPDLKAILNNGTSSSISWQQPVPLRGMHSPNPLPLDAFPEWMTAHIRSVADFVQVPTDLPALLALCVASGALQKKAEIEARSGWTEPLTLWGAGILESGTRKSATFKHMTGPVEDHERLLKDARFCTVW